MDLDSFQLRCFRVSWVRARQGWTRGLKFGCRKEKRGEGSKLKLATGTGSPCLRAGPVPPPLVSQLCRCACLGWSRFLSPPPPPPTYSRAPKPARGTCNKGLGLRLPGLLLQARQQEGENTGFKVSGLGQHHNITPETAPSKPKTLLPLPRSTGPDSLRFLEGSPSQATGSPI